MLKDVHKIAGIQALSFINKSSALDKVSRDEGDADIKSEGVKVKKLRQTLLVPNSTTRPSRELTVVQTTDVSLDLFSFQQCT